VGSARSDFDAAVTAHLDAATLLRGAAADARDDNLQVKQLRERLSSQAARIGAAATELRLPAPRLSVESAPATPDVAAALGRAETAMQQADTALGNALRGVARASGKPVLLPDASPVLRAALVYFGLSLLAWVVQFALLAATDYQLSTAVGSLCGLPLLAFGGGVLILQTLGQPRGGEKIEYPVKLGAVICLAGLPVMWLILLVGFAILR